MVMVLINFLDRLMTLTKLSRKQKAKIKALTGPEPLRQRLVALGVLRGLQVSVVATSLLGNPHIYFIGKQQICLRNKEAVTLRWSYSPDVRKYPLLHHRPGR